MTRAHDFSRKTRTLLFTRAGGLCEKCHAVLKRSEGEADHILPVELGGESDAENGQWLCRVCHRVKTTDDVARIRKADRMHAKANNLYPKSKTPLRSRGFAKTREVQP